MACYIWSKPDESLNFVTLLQRDLFDVWLVIHGIVKTSSAALSKTGAPC